jgi:hypothetical protein
MRGRRGRVFGGGISVICNGIFFDELGGLASKSQVLAAEEGPHLDLILFIGLGCLQLPCVDSDGVLWQERHLQAIMAVKVLVDAVPTTGLSFITYRRPR